VSGEPFSQICTTLVHNVHLLLLINAVGAEELYLCSRLDGRVKLNRQIETEDWIWAVDRSRLPSSHKRDV